MTLPSQIAELRRHADNLAQSDSRWREAADVYAEIRRLEGKVEPLPLSAHVEAYQAHLQEVGRQRFMANASPRFIAAHAAIERATGGAISYSHLAN